MNRYLPAIEPLIRVLGRTPRRDPLPLFWTASGIEFVTDGSEVTLELEADYAQYEQWIRVEVNGAGLIRMPLQRGMNQITVFRSCEAGKPRHVRLFKEVQAMGADEAAMLLVHAVVTDGRLLPLPEYSCKLEFVGDSITSGEGLAGDRDFMDWVACMFSTQDHYALRTAAALKADLRIVSQSGWGYYCSWDNHPECTLPSVYEQVCGPLKGARNASLGASEPNSFADWQPDAIVVNLGTNDDASFGSPAYTDEQGVVHKQERGEDGKYSPASADRLRNAVDRFLHMLRRDNPDAYILMTFGIYPGSEMSVLLQDVLKKYQGETGDDRCGYLEYEPIRDEWFGSRGHPGKLSHLSAAEAVTGRLRTVLKIAE